MASTTRALPRHLIGRAHKCSAWSSLDLLRRTLPHTLWHPPGSLRADGAYRTAACHAAVTSLIYCRSCNCRRCRHAERIEARAPSTRITAYPYRPAHSLLTHAVTFPCSHQGRPFR